MTELAKRIADLARGLPAIERATLIDELLASLDQVNADIDAKWIKGSEDRIVALERGEMNLVDFDETTRDLRKR